MLVQDIEVQLVGPPVSVRHASAGCLWVWSARYRVLSFVSHNVSSFLIRNDSDQDIKRL
jgi:hypothetical protein